MWLPLSVEDVGRFGGVWGQQNIVFLANVQTGVLIALLGVELTLHLHFKSVVNLNSRVPAHSPHQLSVVRRFNGCYFVLVVVFVDFYQFLVLEQAWLELRVRGRLRLKSVLVFVFFEYFFFCFELFYFFVKLIVQIMNLVKLYLFIFLFCYYFIH